MERHLALPCRQRQHRRTLVQSTGDGVCLLHRGNNHRHGRICDGGGVCEEKRTEEMVAGDGSGFHRTRCHICVLGLYHARRTVARHRLPVGGAVVLRIRHSGILIIYNVWQRGSVRKGASRHVLVAGHRLNHHIGMSHRCHARLSRLSPLLHRGDGNGHHSTVHSRLDGNQAKGTIA